MSNIAANLVDHVFPHVPVRQWVLTVPFHLRFKIAYNHELCREVLRIFVRAVYSHLRLAAKHEFDLDTVNELSCGSVTFIQRANSALALSPHFHVLVLDGVYEGDGWDHPPVFRALPPPTKAELKHVAEKVWGKVQKLLGEDDELEQIPDKEPSLLELSAASVTSTTTTGRGAGQRLQRLRDQAPPDDHGRGGLCGEYEGFNIHAGVRVPAHDRKRLERLARYGLRPAIDQSRITKTEDGKIIYQLKRIWSDGSYAVVYEPLEFLARIVNLVPRPWSNQLIYHGVLAAHATVRPQIVPAPPKAAVQGDKEHCQHGGHRSKRIDWASLLWRVYGVDPLQCPRCGSRCEIIACILDSQSLRAILESVGMPTAPPTRKPARRSVEQLEFDFDFDQRPPEDF